MRRLFLHAILLLACPGLRAAEPDFVNGIAAIVNGAVITEQDLQEYTRSAIDLVARQYRGDPQKFQQEVGKIRGEAVDQLVERQLILHEFKTAGYNEAVVEPIVEDEIKKRIRERFGDRVTLTRTLQGLGITSEAFRQQIREEIIVDALRARHVSSEITVSPHKIEMFYLTNREAYKLNDQIKLRMITLNHNTDAQAENAGKLASEIVKKLEEGASFAEMATIYSEGSQRTQGGDWGWVEKSVLRKELADVAFTLKPGKPSQVVKTPTASYIMLVEEIRPSHIRPLPEIRAEIEKNLLIQERARLNKKWIDRLRAKSFVRYF